MTEPLQREASRRRSYLRATRVNREASKQHGISNFWAQIANKYIKVTYKKKKYNYYTNSQTPTQHNELNAKSQIALILKQELNALEVSSLCPLAYAQLTLIGCPNLKTKGMNLSKKEKGLKQNIALISLLTGAFHFE